MERAPGVAEILSHWSWDLPWLGLGALAAGAYLQAWSRARRRGTPHPAWRASMFVAGVTVMLLAVLSPIEHYGNVLLWANFTGFLFITMIAPPLILLGAPLTLAFRVAGPARRRLLRGAYRNRAVAAITFPVVTWLGFAVVTYAWQFTALTGEAASNVFLRDLQQATLLLAGLLFWSPVLAADPLRWRMPYPLRALYVAVEMAHKALFGGMFLGMNTAMHERFAANAPAWAPAAITDQRMAILVLWLGGNLVFVAALAALVLGWVRYEQRNQHRTDWRLRLQREAAERRRKALEQVFTRPV